MMTMTAVRTALLAELGGDSSKLYFINTRLILSVGIDLNEASEHAGGDPEKVKSVVASLKKMGFLRTLGGRREA